MDQDSLLRQREMRIERESEKGEREREEREGVVLSLQFGSSFKIGRARLNSSHL